MCKIYDLDQSTLAAPPTIFAQFPRTDVAFVDGIYFDPTGTYLFVTNRDVVGDSNSVLVVRRPEDVDGTHPLIVHTMPAPAGTEPDGVAFHATQHFAVTNDEEGDSMTKFSFPEVTGIEGSYAVTNFALGRLPRRSPQRRPRQLHLRDAGAAQQRDRQTARHPV